MLASLKRVTLGLILIVGASALLLLSDSASRRPAAGTPPAPAPQQRHVRVALLQHAPQLVLEQGRDGMLAGLADRGWVQGKNLTVKFYNAEGDMPVAQAIAKEMVSGGYDQLLTVSTVSLQAVANANKAGKTNHVFALVTDPYGAGVGINRENHLDHPPHLAGFATMQPVALAFKTAREMNPALANVGVVWNAAESNSEAQVKLARKICTELGISLLEATIDNSAGVSEAANALVSRGVDALWMGGDVMVMTAVDSVIAAARKGRIPVFTVIPPNAKRGALFDLGADYPEVGRLAGQLAGDILNGRNPATVPIDNVMPEMLTLNLQTLAGLKATWTATPALRARAQLVIDEAGVEHSKAAAASPSPGAVATPPRSAAAANPNPSRKKWKIALVLYNETPPAEQTLAGMADAWKHSPLVEGRDYELKIRNAQGDMPAISGMLDAAVTDGADIIVPLSTPTLQVAVQRVKAVPIVFSLVADPVIAGAGRSYTDHLPNVTGIAVLAPVGEALDLIKKHFPAYQRLGTLFCPAEANSVALKESLEGLCRQRGLVLETVAVNTSSELPDAALALVSRPIDAIVQLSDNLSSSGFTAITRAARQAKKPLLSLNSTTIPLGAAVALGRDYHNAGEATTALIERIIAGENPAQMPFMLPPKIISSVSTANAAAVGMTLPPALLREVKNVLP